MESRGTIRELFKHVAYTYTLEIGGFSAFGMAYGVCEIVAQLHSYRVRIHLDAELAIPFVPAMTLAYVSLYLMFSIVPFVLRTRREVTALFWTFMAEVAIATVFFLAMPVEPAWPATHDAGAFAPLFDWADGMNLTYNLFPSIHVAFAASAAMILSNRGIRGVLITAWAVLVCASTVLTHQHHLADIAGGLVLAIVCVRRFYIRPLRLSSGT